MLDPCPDCHEYGMYCQCDELFSQKWDEMWEHNIDNRNYSDYMDDYDEYMMEKWENSQPSDEELAQRLKDEIEMLIDLDLD